MKQQNPRSRVRRLAGGLAAGVVIATALAGASWSPAEAKATGTATVTPSDHLVDGESVDVALSGFPAGAMVVGVQCDERILSTGDNTYCNLGNIAFLTPDENGNATTTFTVNAGAGFTSANGTGVCDAQHPCVLAFSTQGQPEATNAVASIAFGSTTTTDAGPAKRTVKAGQKVKLAVTVGSEVEGMPTGSVVVKDGTTELAAKSLSDSGEVSFNLRLTPGQHKLKVRYTGDAAYLASSDAVAVTVKPKR